jgi:hypothetical protein
MGVFYLKFQFVVVAFKRKTGYALSILYEPVRWQPQGRKLYVGIFQFRTGVWISEISRKKAIGSDLSIT